MDKKRTKFDLGSLTMLFNDEVKYTANPNSYTSAFKKLTQLILGHQGHQANKANTAFVLSLGSRLF